MQTYSLQETRSPTLLIGLDMQFTVSYAGNNSYA
jgi:hypothetical protein